MNPLYLLILLGIQSLEIKTKKKLNYWTEKVQQEPQTAEGTFKHTF